MNLVVSRHGIVQDQDCECYIVGTAQCGYSSYCQCGYKNLVKGKILASGYERGGRLDLMVVAPCHKGHLTDIPVPKGIPSTVTALEAKYPARAAELKRMGFNRKSIWYPNRLRAEE